MCRWDGDVFISQYTAELDLMNSYKRGSIACLNWWFQTYPLIVDWMFVMVALTTASVHVTMSCTELMIKNQSRATCTLAHKLPGQTMTSQLQRIPRWGSAATPGPSWTALCPKHRQQCIRKWEAEIQSIREGTSRCEETRAGQDVERANASIIWMSMTQMHFRESSYT